MVLSHMSLERLECDRQSAAALVEAHPLSAARELARCDGALRPWTEAHFYPADTGAGSSALIYEHSDGTFYLVMSANGPEIPATLQEPVTVAFNDADGRVIACQTFPDSFHALPALRRCVVDRIRQIHAERVAYQVGG